MTDPQKLKNRTTIWSSNSVSSIYLKVVKAVTGTDYLLTHIHSNIILNREKAGETQASSDRWMDKMWYKHTMEY